VALGLLIGLGYLAASFFMQSKVLEQAGTQVSLRIQEVQDLNQTYQAHSKQIDTLKSQFEQFLQEIRSKEATYQSQYRDFQPTMTSLVRMGKQYQLTFLDFHFDASEPLAHFQGGKLFTSTLSLGGNFEHIQSFLQALSKSQSELSLPIRGISMQTSKEGHTRLQLHFAYVGELGIFLDQVTPKSGEETQS
jgi:uncharacterized protein YukE